MAHFGQDLSRDARRCEALLRDCCGSEHQKQVFMLATAIKAGVTSEILTWKQELPRKIGIARLSRRLEADFGFSSEAGEWTIVTWAFALGVDV